MISYLGILAGLREIANRIKSDVSAPHPATLREYNRLRGKLLLSGYPRNRVEEEFPVFEVED